MEKNSKIYIAGHDGMVGSAIVRKLQNNGFNNLAFRTIKELDLTDQSATKLFFEKGNIWHEIKPKKDEIIIHKPSYGAFWDTPLETILKNMKKDTVIICGTMTNYCCGVTARQAYERCFKVIFGSDVTSTDIPEMHDYELKVLRKGFAKILTTEEIIKQL